MEGHLAATLSTARISFCATVDTHSPNASGLVQPVETFAVLVVNVVFGDAVILQLNSFYFQFEMNLNEGKGGILVSGWYRYGIIQHSENYQNESKRTSSSTVP
jgi:hypothetical protein